MRADLNRKVSIWEIDMRDRPNTLPTTQLQAVMTFTAENMCHKR